MKKNQTLTTLSQKFRVECLSSFAPQSQGKRVKVDNTSGSDLTSGPDKTGFISSVRFLMNQKE